MLIDGLKKAVVERAQDAESVSCQSAGSQVLSIWTVCTTSAICSAFVPFAKTMVGGSWGTDAYDGSCRLPGSTYANDGGWMDMDGGFGGPQGDDDPSPDNPNQ